MKSNKKKKKISQNEIKFIAQYLILFYSLFAIIFKNLHDKLQ